jgi:hypothetical protein
MRTLNARWIVALGVAMGAVVTWLWGSNGVMPSASRAVVPQTSVPHALAGPQAALSAIPTARDDSTYSRMLALAVSRSDAAEVTRMIAGTHERFVLTPDDPDWGRQTEQALRDFFRSRSANKSKGIEITSVSCRSAGCEVQAEVQMQGPIEPVVGNGSTTASVDEENGREVLQEIWPVGPSLRREDYLGSDLYDTVGTAESVGFIVWYRRVEPKPEAHSTSPQ